MKMVKNDTYIGNALRVAIEITILVLLLSVNANAATLTVCPDGCSYSSIQTGINASNDGDIIQVQYGTYYENVNVTKQLTLQGIGMPVVDAGGNGSAITLAANGIRLEGFTAIEAGNYPEAGIKVTSTNNTLNGNNASNNTYGIYLIYSSNNTMSVNNASNNTYGILLDYSGNNTLNSNNASRNGNGIELFSSSNNTLSGNNLSNNNMGIYMHWSSNNTLNGNTMTGNKANFYLDGDTDSHFEHYIDISNLVDGRLIYYMIKASDTIYDSSTNVGTLYCISCVNMTVKNLNMSKNSAAIFFWKTTYSKIQNVNASNNYYGIKLYHSYNNTLSDNDLLNNDDLGILLSGSNNNTLSGNNLSNNHFRSIYMLSSSYNTLSDNNVNSNREHGIYIVDSSNNTLNGNNVSNNYIFGIVLDGSSNNTLSGNNASNNGNRGINLLSSNNNKVSENYLSNEENGIYLASSFNNKVSGNNLSNNQYGILLSNSNSNIVISNYFNANNQYGIYLSTASNNRFYDNFFNTKNQYQCCNNDWNTTKISGINIIGGPHIGGNFWANPGGTGFSQNCKDEDIDGICDSSYLLASGNMDYLPLTIPTGYGYISGKVMNYSIPIAGAIVTTNISNTTNTDVSGMYSLLVPAGTYDLTSTSEPGFYPNSSVTISVESGKNVIQDIELIKKPMGDIMGTISG